MNTVRAEAFRDQLRHVRRCISSVKGAATDKERAGEVEHLKLAARELANMKPIRRDDDLVARQADMLQEVGAIVPVRSAA